MTSLIDQYPRAAQSVDLWFDMHEKPEEKHPKWWIWALENQPRCMLLKQRDELVNSRAYPVDEIISRFGLYFTSSVSYMLALAIARGARWIGLYGIDMACGSEYYHQRACCEYLIGLAVGSGITVDIPKDSALLKSRWLYGYDEDRPTTENERLIEEMSIWRAEALALRRLVPEDQRPKLTQATAKMIEELNLEHASAVSR